MCTRDTSIKIFSDNKTFHPLIVLLPCYLVRSVLIYTVTLAFLSLSDAGANVDAFATWDGDGDHEKHKL